MFGPETTFLVAVPDKGRSEEIARTIREAGWFNVITVDDGAVAHAVIQRRPDVFLVASWDLPGLSGLGLVNEVRHGTATREMAVILIGSPPIPQAMAQARELKVNAFCLGANFRADSLLEKVHKIMAPGRDEIIWPDKLQALADELMDLGRVDEAVAVLRRLAQETASRTAALHGEMGVLLLEKGEVEEAVASLETAVRDNPGHARAQAALGKAYLDSGRPEKAAMALKIAHQVDPHNEEVQARLGESLLATEKFDRAEEVFQDLLNRNPENMFYLNRLAIALRKQFKYDQALALYNKALEIGRDDENLYFNLGRCFWEAGRREDAVRNLKKALDIRPGFTGAEKLLEKIGVNG